MIEVKFCFKSIEEAIAALKKIDGNDNQFSLPLTTTPQPDPLPEPEPAPEPQLEAFKPRRGRPPKAAPQSELEPVAAEPVAEPEPAPEVQTTQPAETPAETSYTVDDARAALTRLNESKGLEEVRNLLMHFGATRISEVPVERLGELIAACPAA